ncbi:MAG: hypothetical protein WDN29_00995 [Methylovirgula sp.]
MSFSAASAAARAASNAALNRSSALAFSISVRRAASSVLTFASSASNCEYRCVSSRRFLFNALRCASTFEKALLRGAERGLRCR